MGDFFDLARKHFTMPTSNNPLSFFVERDEYVQTSINMGEAAKKKLLWTVFQSPLLGVGLGNFIPSLVRFLPGSFLLSEKLQPVHNLPVLLVSEIGFVGLALIVLLLHQNYRKILNPQFLTLVVIVIITGSFDHYWWTLPQNKLILLLAGAILL